MKKQHLKSFTLIELLVVIAILAGLVAILFPNIMETRMRSRDAQRKTDLKNIQNALERYKSDQYPPQYPPDASLPVACSSWSASGVVYMSKVPGDPSGNCSTNIKKYYYHAHYPADPLQYDLYACLENKADLEGDPGPQAPPYFDITAGYTCESGVYYKVTQP